MTWYAKVGTRLLGGKRERRRRRCECASNHLAYCENTRREGESKESISDESIKLPPLSDSPFGRNLEPSCRIWLCPLYRPRLGWEHGQEEGK